MSSPERRKSAVSRPPSSSLRLVSLPSTPTPLHSSSSFVHPPQSLEDSSRPSTPPQKSRAKDLLRKHYGLGVGPPPPLPGNAADPMNLDSTAFDPRSYYEQLITTSSLTSLLKKENELLTEMRELDSERQSLVYNHHHELLAASETISTMKTRAESLDADLDLLKMAFSEISRLASEVTVEDVQIELAADPIHYHFSDDRTTSTSR